MSEKKDQKDDQPTFKLEKDSALLTRLARFQRETIDIGKSKKAHGYKYAPLDVICESIGPFLGKHGIGYSHKVYWSTDLNSHMLRTKLFSEHNPEDYEESEIKIDEEVKLVNQNKYMVLGSAITYFRRYHLVTMLGLTTDEDTDAGGAIKDNSKSTAGRSVDASTQVKGQTNYVDIFTKLIAKKKTKEQVVASYKVHKKNMAPEMLTAVESLIKKAFENESK